MSTSTPSETGARPGLLLGLIAVVVVTLLAVFFLKPGGSQSSEVAKDAAVNDSSSSPPSSDAQAQGTSGMRLIQRTGTSQQSDQSATGGRSFSGEMELDEAFLKALANPVAVLRDEQLTALAGQFAEQNPELAVAVIQDAMESGSRNKAPVLHFVQAFATANAAIDPRAAAALTDQLPADAQVQYGTIVGAEWVKHDVSGATQWGLELGDANLRNSIIGAISGAIEREGTPQMIDAWANALIQSPVAMDFVSQLARTWPISDALSTMEWLNTLPEPGRQVAAYQEMATSMASRNIQDATRWIAQFPEQSGIRAQAVDNVAYSWSKTDHEAAREWAASMGRLLINSETPSGASLTSGP